MGLTKEAYENSPQFKDNGLTYSQYMSKLGGKGGKKTNRQTRSPKGAAAWTRERQQEHAKTHLLKVQREK